MKAYEAAKRLKMDNKTFLEEYGVKSHLSKISTDLEAELFGEEKKIETESSGKEAVDIPEVPVVVPEPPDVCPFTKNQVARGIRVLGNKSSCWKWRHILDG